MSAISQYCIFRLRAISVMDHVRNTAQCDNLSIVIGRISNNCVCFSYELIRLYDIVYISNGVRQGVSLVH